MKALVSPARHQVGLIDLPAPRPEPGEVRVRVLAASLNPVDAMVRDGMFHDLGHITHSQPLGLGWDLVGVVDDVGEEEVGWAPGKRVAALLTGPDKRLGALSEFVVVPAKDLAAVPDGLDHDVAAAVGMNAVTASQALDHLGPADGRALLITGAAGGVGGYAVELAVLAGWQVTGLARLHDREFIERPGARLITRLPADEGFDAILDAAPLQLDDDLFTTGLAPSLRDGGTLVSVLGALPLPTLPLGRSATAVSVTSDASTLERLLTLAAEGTLTPRVAGTVQLTEFDKAFVGMGSGGRGRWVLQPNGPTD
ncbi:NADP-dependent oxidoreductase [Knoellia sp. CPCC 206453]|uniref:NADP-dependent oxidoreductase n=1 Tax=Knoellia pratensis TaxID=3404796 RepID=UPI00360C8E66